MTINLIHITVSVVRAAIVSAATDKQKYNLRKANWELLKDRTAVDGAARTPPKNWC